MIEGDFQFIVSNKKHEESIKIDVQIHLRIHRSHLTKERSSAIYCDHFMLLRGLAYLPDSVPAINSILLHTTWFLSKTGFPLRYNKHRAIGSKFDKRMQAGRGGGASIYKIRRQNEPFQNGIGGYNYLINIKFYL